MSNSLPWLSSASLIALALAGPAHAAGEPERTVSELVVTAAPYTISLDTITTSVDILTARELSLAPPAGIGDLLAGMPGLRSTAYGPGASRPVIRGLAGPRVLLLQNGVGMVDASSLSPDHAVPSEAGQASRIEVLRGPSTLAYGGSGIGGVVNVMDERVPSRRPGDRIEGRGALAWSSVDNGRSGSLAANIGFGALVLAVDGATRRSGDYSTPGTPVSDRLAAATGLEPTSDTKQRNVSVEADSWGVGGSLVGESGGFLGLSVKRTDTGYGVPYAQVQEDDPPEILRLHMKQTRWDLRGEAPFEEGWLEKIRLSVGHADYEHAEIEVNAGAVGTRFLSKGTEGRLEFVMRGSDGRQGAFGLQGLTRSFEALGDEAFIPGVEINEVGAFTLQRLEFGKAGLDAGLRIDTRQLRANLEGRDTTPPGVEAGLDWADTADTRTFTNVSASAGLFWKPSDPFFLALTLSLSGRAPTEFELFADGPHGGTSTWELGDPNLDSEKAVSLEGTLRWTTDDTRIEAHVWAARYDGFIEERPTGETWEGLPVFRFRQSEADFVGLELEAEQTLFDNETGRLSARLSGDVVRGDTGFGAPPRIPAYGVTGELAWTSEAFVAAIEVRHVGDQTRTAPFELATDGYTALNASLAWRPVPDAPVTLSLRGRNLTDAEIREHASFLKDIAPAPGRSLSAALSWAF
ncbi:TonB-dependent receptor [Phenylobacterium parvum]|nr:TonB-dependent receptor [Phenylobacterium parvum]